ncbi:hypothetical protein [Corynebacterium sp.]|uniref:hypothetical protein n=1 Tax=Corynebacterium sp. TaxID=1720 RepID=UPI0025BEB453|nr:hypothetical protein [Corynebacterium sp.]
MVTTVSPPPQPEYTMTPDHRKPRPSVLLVIGSVVLTVLAIPGGVFIALFILSLLLRI